MVFAPRLPSGQMTPRWSVGDFIGIFLCWLWKGVQHSLPNVLSEENECECLVRTLMAGRYLLALDVGWSLEFSPGGQVCALNLGSGGRGSRETETMGGEECRGSWNIASRCPQIPILHHWLPEHPVTSLDSSLYICSPSVPITVNNWKEYNRVRIIVASPCAFHKSFYIRGVWPQPLLAL